MENKGVKKTLRHEKHCCHSAVWQYFSNVFSWIKLMYSELKSLQLVLKPPNVNKSTLFGWWFVIDKVARHSMSQSVTPYGITRSQWINTLRPIDLARNEAWPKWPTFCRQHFHFPNAFLGLKLCIFTLKHAWNWFLRVEFSALAKSQHWLR